MTLKIKNEVMDICHGCPAPCCYFKAVPLTKEESLEPQYEGNLIDLFGTPVIKLQSNGACHFLEVETGLCKTWEKRPYTCRQFSCLEQGY